MPNDFLADLEATIPGLNDILTSRPAAAARADAEQLRQLVTCTDTTASTRGRIVDAVDAERYILAGKATVTLQSVKTGTRYTFRITAAPDGAAHFVGLLTGPDNSTDYAYLGRIARSIFWAGRKSPRPGDVGKDAPSSQAFAWAWKAIVQGTIPAQLEVWHESSCGRCGHKLTVPSSVSQGYGPECINKIWR